jgi:phosphomannomutase
MFILGQHTGITHNMTTEVLVKSTSGVRGVVGNGLDPVMAAAYGAAFGTVLKKGKAVVGRDSRPTGDMIAQATISGLLAVGIDVVYLGIVPTPTVEIAVKKLKAAGGICLTASHNPSQWNALKFFNSFGEFVTPMQYRQLDRIYDSGKFAYVPYSRIGKLTYQDNWADYHIKETLKVKTVDRSAVKKARFKVVVDAVNGAGSYALPTLLEKLGARVIRINCDGSGHFPHEPEPLPKNLAQLGKAVKKHKADLGMACDPDADRLALVDEDGKPVGEELTLSIAVKQVLRTEKGPTVLNLSTSRTTVEVAREFGSRVYLSKVGEANVVEMMRKKRGIIGGEGNGGVIYPRFHAGRDSLIAAALVLSCLASERITLSDMARGMPQYYMEKTKGPLPRDFEHRLKGFERRADNLFGIA